MSKPKKEPGKRGPKTKWKDEFVEQAGKLALLGFTNAQLADFFKVAGSTFDNWIAKYPELMGALKEKSLSDCDVGASLYKRACGFTGPDDKYYPPDPTSMIFWLKNRQPELFRDKQPEKTGEGDNIEKAAKALERIAEGLPD